MFLGLAAWNQTQAIVEPVDRVNPFIGTTHYGTTHPGALVPNGLMSVMPFNVMGSKENKFDKDAQWWSTGYDNRNTYFTGFSHVNLSGVGCPDLGSLLLMATTGDLEVDYKNYGSGYTDEQASPGYYANRLTKYNVFAEATATTRSGVTRFTFPKGQSNILLNLGEGLTNESGAMVRKVNDYEIEGVKLLGTFCYAPQAVFPIYFVMRVNKKPEQFGYWKKQREMLGPEKDWDADQGKNKLYTQYTRELAGDDIGAFFRFNTEENEQIEVQMGVSFVSTENARLNLDTEQKNKNFEAIRMEARKRWNDDLSRISVEGGTDDQQTVFYTALYHALIHPNILQDVNGEYPKMETGEIGTTKGDRYTVYSLWDTYRNIHQLMTLVYPERQIEMMRTMIEMYKESGWMPKWELYGRETFTMEGDPSIIVLADSYFKGLRDFDVETAYEAMYKSATTEGALNKMRPDNDDYLQLGYVPLREQYDNSVSHALEYYIADYSLSRFADALGKKKDAERFLKQSLNYKKYYSKEFGTLRPKLPNGEFYSPFNPRQGENFEPNPGFHEGNAWNYTFFVPHDVYGLAKLMGGKKAFVNKLQGVFDNNLYDPANEPDIAYPYLFSYFPGEEWRTQVLTQQLLNRHFTNKTNGIPGNDDTGTMSAWAIFNMIGFYPDCPGVPEYTLTAPVFDKVTIKLDPKWHGAEELVIETEKAAPSDIYLIDEVSLGDKKSKARRISHDDLIKAGTLKMKLKESTL